MSATYERLPIVAQNLACTFAGWQRERARFTPYFHRVLKEWERSVQAPVAALHAIQRERLDRLVRRAREHTRFWRDLPPPSPARDPEEALARTLASIPPLDKGTYRDHAAEFIASDIPSNRLRKGKTSGTTGTALPLWYTAETLAEEYATVWRLRRACGVELGEPHLSFGGQIIVPLRQDRPPYWRANWWGRQTLFSLYHMKPENLPSYVDAVHSSPASYVQGYPSSLHLVARAMLEQRRPLAKGRLAAVFTSSESLLAFQREVIETAFGAPVRDRYGTSEFAVSMTSCPERHLHVDMEFGIVEVEVEEETDEWVRGPLLVTGLGNEATPLLRYQIGDVGTRSKRSCPCGRPGDVFVEVDGRLEDYVVTPDGRWIGRLDHIFKEQLGVAEAQILQERRGAIEVRIVPRAIWDAASEQSLLKEIRARLGDAIEIEMRLVETIPREANGKFRAVKSALGRPAGIGGSTGPQTRPSESR
jgi:phenylacetate-CoA ligase